jgi:hypothetical protein
MSRPQLTAPERAEIVRLYQSGLGAIPIGQKFGRCHGTILKVLAKAGIPRRTIAEGKTLYHDRTVNAERQAGVVADYLAGKSLAQINARWGGTGPTVYTALRRANVEYRQKARTLDETAFDVVGEESAYWAGFLMADGCVVDRPGRWPEVKLSVKGADRPHLEAFQRFLKTDHVIGDKIDHGRFPQVSLSVASRGPLVMALAKYGVVPRKTASARVFGLEDNRHFWRGLVDGDGSIHVNGRRPCNSHITCVGSEALMKQFQQFAATHLGGKMATIRPLRPRKIWQIGWASSWAVRMARLLYGDCAIALPRKLDRAATIMGLAIRPRAAITNSLPDTGPTHP